jgi:hypothetical protein
MSSGTVLSVQPATTAEAAREVDGARTRLDHYARDYAASRAAGEPAAMTRARTQWGLAVYEWAGAVIACARAADRENAARRGKAALADRVSAAPADRHGTGGSDLTAAPAKQRLAAAHTRVEATWYAYADVRSGPDVTRIDRARRAWEAALTEWALATVATSVAEDRDAVAARRRREDRAMRLSLATACGTGSWTPAQVVAARFRERARRERREHGGPPR